MSDATASQTVSDLDELFPPVDPGIKPLGSRLLVQIRTPVTKTKSGLFMPEQARDTEKWNTQIAKVIAVGPLAFRNRDTQELWPEGAWCKAGDFIRVPKYQGDRMDVPIPGRRGEDALFVLFEDIHVLGIITGDPGDIKVYL